ncbi:MAG TPA: RNA methyltransferase [Casimicrobiaceae bacterium]|nr:RNA methyltransferase [Casimicrobiaceae bacterium]
MQDAPDRVLERARVVLVRTSHPGNIGACARAMHTMGLARLVLVDPRRFPDPEADARATGAAHLLGDALVVASLDAAIADCTLAIGFSARPRELGADVLSVRTAAQTIVRASQEGPVAMVFGNEMSGLSNEELARCTAFATIPANPAYSSLNLAAAVQIAAYELRIAVCGEGTWTSPRFAPATQGDIESLYAHAQRTLAELRFYNPDRPRRLLPRLRRLFARTGLEREEVNILRGVLASIDRALGNTQKK